MNCFEVAAKMFSFDRVNGRHDHEAAAAEAEMLAGHTRSERDGQPGKGISARARRL
jgi:hypothetical protein